MKPLAPIIFTIVRMCRVFMKCCLQTWPKPACFHILLSIRGALPLTYCMHELLEENEYSTMDTLMRKTIFVLYVLCTKLLVSRYFFIGMLWFFLTWVETFYLILWTNLLILNQLTRHTLFVVLIWKYKSSPRLLLDFHNLNAPCTSLQNIITLIVNI